MIKPILMLAALALAGAWTVAAGQPACCADNGGPSGACSPSGRVMCMDGTASACTCGASTSPPPTLGQLAMPPTVTLGAVTIGTTSLPVTARITNVGALPVAVAGVTSDAPQEFIVTGHTCGVVAGGGSCTVDVAFKPWIEGGRSTQVRVASNGVGAPQAFAVIASAVAPAASAAPPAADAPKLAVVEYAHSEWDHYFVTAMPREIARLDDGTFAGWKRTGLAFKAYPNGLPGTVSMCRFFSTSFAPRSSHFYTPDATECAKVRANPDWSFEGDVFGVVLPAASGLCPSGLLPLYRLYNDGRGGAPNHRYTLDLALRSIMVAFGWRREGSGPLGVIACTPA